MKSKAYPRLILFLLVVADRLTLCLFEFLNTTLSKEKREVPIGYKYLIFPQGSNVQLVYCMTVATLGKPAGLFTVGVTAGLAYELPYEQTVAYRKPAEVYHRRSRRDLYRKIELMLNTQGKDGRSCVLFALCQAGKRNREDKRLRTFLEEMSHAIFTYPPLDASTIDEPEEKIKSSSLEYDRAYNAQIKCEQLFPDARSCPSFF